MEEIKRESKFDGGLLGLIGIGILSGFIVLITLGIATPWAICLKEKWYVSHTVIDGKRLVFDGTGGQLFGNYIKWFLLTIITLGIYSFLAFDKNETMGDKTHAYFGSWTIGRIYNLK